MSFNIQTHGRSPSTKVFSFKSKITRETTEFYAENGLITIEGAHYKTGEPYFKRESRKEFLLRAAALSLELKRMPYKDERLDLQRCVEVMVDCARSAGHQGDPLNPKHFADMVNAPRAKVLFGPRGQAISSGYTYDPGIPPIPRAPADKPVRELGGDVVSPSRLILPG